MKKIYYLFLMLLIGSTSPLYAEALMGSTQTGTIQSVDIEERSIQIGAFTFKLADNLQIITSFNTNVSQLMLSPGQNVEYWLDSSQLVFKISILTGLSAEEIKK